MPLLSFAGLDGLVKVSGLWLRVRVAGVRLDLWEARRLSKGMVLL